MRPKKQRQKAHDQTGNSGATWTPPEAVEIPPSATAEVPPDAAVEGPPSSEVILAQASPEVLDAEKLDLVEGDQSSNDVRLVEPTYPIHEWQSAAPLVFSDQTWTNDELIGAARSLLQAVTLRMRRTVQEWWLIGHHLNVLKQRPENEGRWRTEILPAIGINHTTDNQLRRMAEEVPFDDCLQFTNKTQALKAIGALPAPASKTEGPTEIETAEFGSVVDNVQGVPPDEADGMLAGPIEVPQLVVASLDGSGPPDGTDPEFGETTDATSEEGVPLRLTGAQSVATPDADATPQTTASNPKTSHKSEAKFKAPPEPDQEPQEPEGAGAEAFVVLLNGATAAEVEPDLLEADMVVLSRRFGRVVALLWLGDDDYEVGKARVRTAIKKLRATYPKLKAEANYLYPGDLIAV